jgi:predicted phage terminase large subunit-like protein
MFASKGEWVLYRHTALFNRVALVIAGALLAGVGFNLLVCIQPQIGKSDFWSKYFPAWICGNFPDKCIALSSYEATFASDKGRAVRDLMETVGPEVFGITVRQDKRAADDWELHDLRSGEFRRGGMVTTGVGGPLTGRPVDIGIIDDPIKNAEEASSEAHLEKIHDWYQSVFSSRFKEGGVKIVVMTRWSHKDLVARIQQTAKESGEKWTELILPAIADKDEAFHIEHPDGRKEDLGWSRRKGDVVCPQLFSLATMEKRQKNTLPFWFATMYLQQPYPREGGEFQSAWFKIVKQVPANLRYCRSWDLAGTKNKSAAQTAGVKIGFTGIGEDREYYITNIVADWWSSGERDAEIKQVAKTDGKSIDVIIEQEPGSGGKTQAEAIEKKLDGHSTHIVVAGNEGSKQLRADPLASAAHAGKVFLLEADWNEKFLEQVRRFPGGKPIDMIDGAAQGYNWLADQPDPEVLDPDQMLGPEDNEVFGTPQGSVFG